MKRTRLSIIIPCYNHGAYLDETLNCFPNYFHQEQYEIIIVNDGSTEERTLMRLAQLEKRGYNIIHQANHGLASARTNAIGASLGEYILPLDSDDKLSATFIDEVISIFDHHPEYAVIYSDGEYFDAKQGPWIIGDFNLQRLMLWNYMHAGAAFRRSAWEKVGGYDTNLNHLGFEDWDLWLSIAFSGGKFHYLQKPRFWYRINASSMVRQFTREKYKRMQDYIKEKHRIYLSDDHLTNHLVVLMKHHKWLWVKLSLRVYFPKI